MTHWTVSTDSSRTTHGTLHVDNHRVATAGPLDEIRLTRNQRTWLHLERINSNTDDEQWHLLIGDQTLRLRIADDGTLTTTSEWDEEW